MDLTQTAVLTANQVKKILLSAVLVFSIMLYSQQALSLDEANAIPDSNTKVLNNLITEFGIKNISKSTKTDLYNSFEYALKGDWHAYWTGNGDLKKSKMVNNPIKFVDLIVVNDSRTYTFTYVYFPNEKQILYSAKQFVETDSATALANHNKMKDDKAQRKLRETDNFAFYQKDGFLDFSIYHVKTPHGGTTYIDYGVIDLN